MRMDFIGFAMAQLGGSFLKGVIVVLVKGRMTLGGPQ